MFNRRYDGVHRKSRAVYQVVGKYTNPTTGIVGLALAKAVHDAPCLGIGGPIPVDGVISGADQDQSLLKLTPILP